MKNKKKFSWKKFWMILGVIVAVLAGLAYWQRGNIAAAIIYFRDSEEEIAKKITENEKKVAEAMEKLPSRPIIDLTDDEKEQLAKNEISKEEAIQIILNKSNPTISTPPDPEPTAPQQTPPSATVTPPPAQTATAAPPAQTPAVSDSEQKIAEIIAEIYVLRAYYTSALEGMRQSAIAEYNALGEEKRTNAVKQELGVKYMGMASSLESECDAKMSDVVARLEKELKNTGGDLSIINDVKYTYANEKSLKKAFYLNMYK